jgi:hypothetical protein
LVNSSRRQDENRGCFYINGNLIEISGMKHIQIVIMNPPLFDLSIEEIREKYREYNEPIGFEGKARKEILTRVLENGWIRIRENTKENKWTIECYDHKAKEDNINDIIAYISSTLIYNSANPLIIVKDISNDCVTQDVLDYSKCMFYLNNKDFFKGNIKFYYSIEEYVEQSLKSINNNSISKVLGEIQ